MPDDLTVIEIEEMCKAIKDGFRDLLEDVQIVNIDVEMILEGNLTSIWQDLEDLCSTRRELSEKFERLRVKLKEVHRF